MAGLLAVSALQDGMVKRYGKRPDVNISFRLKYGVTGACFRTRQPAYADATLLRSGELALPSRVAQQTPDLQAILSYPVYEPAPKGRPQSGKLVGVLNLDSVTKGAYNLLVGDVFDQLNATSAEYRDNRGSFLWLREAKPMAKTPNPKLQKMANGSYTIRDYEHPKDVHTGDLRKIADDVRHVRIVVDRPQDKSTEQS